MGVLSIVRRRLGLGSWLAAAFATWPSHPFAGLADTRAKASMPNGSCPFSTIFYIFHLAYRLCVCVCQMWKWHECCDSIVVLFSGLISNHRRHRREFKASYLQHKLTTLSSISTICHFSSPIKTNGIHLYGWCTHISCSLPFFLVLCCVAGFPTTFFFLILSPLSRRSHLPFWSQVFFFF